LIFLVEIAGGTTVQFVSPGLQEGSRVSPGLYGLVGGAALITAKPKKAKITATIDIFIDSLPDILLFIFKIILYHYHNHNAIQILFPSHILTFFLTKYLYQPLY